MILPPLVDSLRNQDWSTVIVEIGIVVLGVFLDIEVANRNEERAEADLADRYRVQLIDDVRSDMADVDIGYRTSQWRLAALTVLLERVGVALPETTFLPESELTLPRLPVENDLIQLLMNASIYTRFLYNHQPTYTSLLSSGNARLIEKLEPWPCIHSYYAQHQKVRQFEDRLLRFRTELVRTQHEAGVSHAGHLSEIETNDRIANDERLLAAMSSNRIWVFYHLVVLDELKQRASVLLESLDRNSSNCSFERGSL
jgi:hypothetical protein